MAHWLSTPSMIPSNQRQPALSMWPKLYRTIGIKLITLAQHLNNDFREESSRFVKCVIYILKNMTD